MPDQAALRGAGQGNLKYKMCLLKDSDGPNQTASMCSFYLACAIHLPHYENTLIQIYWKFLPPKTENFQIKKKK